MLMLTATRINPVVANCRRSVFEVEGDVNAGAGAAGVEPPGLRFIYRIRRILDELTINGERIHVHRAAEQFKNVFPDDHGIRKLLTLISLFLIDYHISAFPGEQV